jgi:Dipeptidyl peptidase IV (DPP IV) N-terminal region
MRHPRARMSGRWLGRLVAAAGSVALLGTFMSGTAQAAYPGSNGLIAFVRAGNIYTIKSSGAASSRVRLTTGGDNAGPRWSPNGKRIAYVHAGNLWVMNANGTHKTRLTDGAPTFTDSRPSWSPNGNYLAFVQTRSGHKYGYLLRYGLLSHVVRVFTTTVNGHLVAVPALPAPVAWAWAQTPASTPSTPAYGSFIVYEGAAALCPQAGKRCLNALGFQLQSQFKNGFPSAELITVSATRLTDPDWYPQHPKFSVDVMTSQYHCGAGGKCAPAGLALTIGAVPTISGAYQGVYSPTGTYIAYVHNVAGVPHVYVEYNGEAIGGPVKLGVGSQPDWQPRPVAVLAG